MSDPKWTLVDPEMWDVPPLAIAWMSLVPPRQGMVVRTTWGKRAVIDGSEDVVAGSWYVDIDSPANWGHWLSVAQDLAGCVPRWMFYGWGPGFPAALLKWLCEDKRAIVRRRLPPSVLAWWKSQQGEVSGAE